MNIAKSICIAKLWLFLLFLFSEVCIHAQDMDFVKKTISDLCSKEFAGRGYTKKGDSLAAAYIVKILKKNKLKYFSGEYYQPFEIRVNTFPGKMSLKINDSALIPGYDYLVSPTSKSVFGKFDVVTMNRKTVDFPEVYNTITPEIIKKSFLLIDTSLVKNKGFKDAFDDIVENNIFGAKGIIEIENKKLIFSPAPFAMPFADIKIQRNALPDTVKTIEIAIENKFIRDYETRNVIAYIPGKIDSFIVFSAHYDHLGEMGDGIYFPGANDNASGTTMTLELARHFAKNQKKLKYSVAFLFFSSEELGFVGSTYYANNPEFPLSKIKFLINLDMVGSGDKGIKVVNGTEYKHEFDTLVSINKLKGYLPDVGIRGPAANSDHYPFYKKGVKSFFIYTLGEYSEYHSIFDEPKALPLSKFPELFKLLLDFVKTF